MNIARIRSYFNDPRTVEYYLKAVANIGLWESEKEIIDRYFDSEMEILDLGCGVGRIALGLAGRGYSNVSGADLAEKMIFQAREIGVVLGLNVDFSQKDATRLDYEEASFDGIVFGFNGLMQIPLRSNRCRALSEIRRALRPGGHFVFTTLDRDDRLYESVFMDESNFEHDPNRNPDVLEYGDRHFETAHGTTFMHVPTRGEVREDLESCGWQWVEDRMRSEIAHERPEVEAFSEDCRFWVVKKPTH